MLIINCYCNLATLQVACRRLTIFLTVFVVSACAWVGEKAPGGGGHEQRADQPSPTQTSVPASQVLLNVRLEGRYDLPQALALDYSRQNGDALESSIGMLQRGLSGQYGDYPILLRLPAGRYRLRSLRVAGMGRNTEGALLSRLDETFDAVTSDTRYIGRLIVAGGNDPAVQPSISWENHYEEDSLLARSAGRALRNQEITDASGQSQESPVAASKERQITIGTIDVVGSTVLYALSDKQKPLFQRFLSTANPRAFAIGDFGAAGFASGSDAIRLALERCGRRGNSESCRILAIDDAVVLASSDQNSDRKNR